MGTYVPFPRNLTNLFATTTYETYETYENWET